MTATEKNLGFYSDAQDDKGYAAHVNAKDQIVMTNNSGGDLVTGDVAVTDTANDKSVTTNTTLGAQLEVFVVSAKVTGDDVTAVQTVVNADTGWFYKAGAYVPKANVDAAVSIGEYLKLSATAKKFTGTGIIQSNTLPPPPGSRAVAREAAAGAGQIAVTLLPPTPVTGYALIVDERAQGTDGGDFNQAAWRTRVLNTEKYDTLGRVSINANQITFLPGTYLVRFTAMAYGVTLHQTRLYNITGAAMLGLGMSSYAPVANAEGNPSAGVCRFTAAADMVVELQHYCTVTKAGNGLGMACNITTEVYAIVDITVEA